MNSIFSFCPRCASKHFVFEQSIKFYCLDCNFTYFHNIAAAVAVIFTHGKEVLFTVRNEEPDKGKWDLPGGFIDPNETAEQAACREVEEELGVIIQATDLKYVTTHPNEYWYKDIMYRTMDIFFTYELVEKNINIKAEDEIKELIWINSSKIELSNIGFISIRNVVKNWI